MSALRDRSALSSLARSASAARSPSIPVSRRIAQRTTSGLGSSRAAMSSPALSDAAILRSRSVTSARRATESPFGPRPSCSRGPRPLARSGVHAYRCSPPGRLALTHCAGRSRQRRWGRSEASFIASEQDTTRAAHPNTRSWSGLAGPGLYRRGAVRGSDHRESQAPSCRPSKNPKARRFQRPPKNSWARPNRGRGRASTYRSACHCCPNTLCSRRELVFGGRTGATKVEVVEPVDRHEVQMCMRDL